MKNNILLETDKLIENAHNENLEKTLDKASYSLLSVNCLLFITLIWKLFSQPAHASFSSITALSFFLLGAGFVIIKYIAGFCCAATEQNHHNEILARYYLKNRKTLSEHEQKDFLESNLKAQVLTKTFLRKIGAAEKAPYWALLTGYVILEGILLAISALFFVLGLFFLIIAAA